MKHRPIEDVVEDVTWLLENGESVENACTRVGYTPGALRMPLQRAGIDDLAAQIGKFERRSRPTHPCADCGAPCTRGAERCRPCGYTYLGRKRAELRWAS